MRPLSFVILLFVLHFRVGLGLDSRPEAIKDKLVYVDRKGLIRLGSSPGFHSHLKDESQKENWPRTAREGSRSVYSHKFNPVLSSLVI